MRWSPANRATHWRVVVKVSDGRRYSFQQTGRRVRLRSIYRSKTITVSVRGIDKAGLLGPARTVTSKGRR